MFYRAGRQITMFHNTYYENTQKHVYCSSNENSSSNAAFWPFPLPFLPPAPPLSKGRTRVILLSYFCLQQAVVVEWCPSLAVARDIEANLIAPFGVPHPTAELVPSVLVVTILLAMYLSPFKCSHACAN